MAHNRIESFMCKNGLNSVGLLHQEGETQIQNVWMPCILALLLLVSATGCAPSESFKLPPGAYLGKTLPGKTPVRFGPDVVTAGYHEHSSPAFSPDGDEVYWSVFYNFWGPQVIVFMKRTAGVWSPPQIAPFSGQFGDGGPCFSPDGTTLYFESQRPYAPGGEPSSDVDLWSVERTEQGWGEPKRLGPEINSKKWERGPTFSRNGNLYFQSMRAGGFGASDIYCAKPTEHGFSQPINLGSKANTSEYEGWPCIAPDESYLLYEAHRKGLMISFKEPDGTWGEPINVSHMIGFRGSQDRFPKLSNDESVLFFGSNARDGSARFTRPLTLDEIKARANQPGNGYGDVYWVDASIIDVLRPHSSRSSN